MPHPLPESTHSIHRRSFIGGTDARIIMGEDEAALAQLWREKRGESLANLRPFAALRPDSDDDDSDPEKQRQSPP